MKYIKYSIAAISLLCFNAVADAQPCKVTQDSAELTNIREDAMMLGNYADGWIFEKPDFDAQQGSIKCEMDENSGVMSCVKKGGKTAFVTLSKARELVSGIIIDNPGDTRFTIDGKGQFTCGAVSETIELDKPNAIEGGVVLQFLPITNSKGSCQPELIDTADTNINGNQLVEVRGKFSFKLPEGVTNTIFQSLHSYPDELGYSETSSQVLLNYDGQCSELTIDITIEYCEYFTDDGRQEDKCPKIEVLGEENFKAINIFRNDGF